MLEKYQQPSLAFPLERFVGDTGEGWRTLLENIASLYRFGYIPELYSMDFAKEKFGELRIACRTRFKNALAQAVPLVSEIEPRALEIWNQCAAAGQMYDRNFFDSSARSNWSLEKVNELLHLNAQLYEKDRVLFLATNFRAQIIEVASLSNHICMICSNIGVVDNHKKDSGYVSACCANCSQTLLSEEEKKSNAHTPYLRPFGSMSEFDLNLFFFFSALRKNPKLLGLFKETQKSDYELSPKNLLSCAQNAQQVLEKFFDIDLKPEFSQDFRGVEDAFQLYLFCFDFIKNLSLYNPPEQLHPLVGLSALPVAQYFFSTQVPNQELFDSLGVLEHLGLTPKVNLPQTIAFLEAIWFHEEKRKSQNMLSFQHDHDEIPSRIKKVIAFHKTHLEKQKLEETVHALPNLDKTSSTKLRKI